MQLETEEYMTIERVNAVRERAGKLRRQFLKYKDAESVYSLTHRKLLEMSVMGYVLSVYVHCRF